MSCGATRRDAPRHASRSAGAGGRRVDQDIAAETFDILHANIRGLCSDLPQLTARLRALASLPTVVCLNETFLEASIGYKELEGYSVAVRRDRKDGRQGGGVIVFAWTDIASRLTLVEESADA